MKSTHEKILAILAGLGLAGLVAGSPAFADTLTGTTTVSFSNNPAPLGAGNDVTISTLTTAPAHSGTPTTATLIDQGKVMIQMANGQACVNGFLPVPSAAAVAWCALNAPGQNPVSGTTSLAVDLNARGFVCGTVGGFRAHYVTGGGAHKVGTHFSAGANLTASCGVPMPVNKLINGESATCTGAPPDANGNTTEARTCTYTQAGLVLVAGDPRFDMNVYATVNGLPGATLGIPSAGLPFPQQGAKIPPEFNIPGGVAIGLSFTMCEAPDTTTLPTPYTLTSATVKVTGGASAGTYNMPIYFHQGHACFNTYPTFPNGVPQGATEFAVDLNNSFVCTYTKGGYGQDGGNNTIGGILSTNFPTVYPNGVLIGDRTNLPPNGATNGWGALFTSPQAIRNYLPVQGGAGSIEGALTTDYTDPSGSQPISRPKGFAEQVLALQMNIDLGDAGVFLPGGGGIGNFFVFTGAGQCGNGKTVRQILAEANSALAGVTPLPTDCSIASMHQLTDNLNNSYDDCRVGLPTSNLFKVPVPAQ